MTQREWKHNSNYSLRKCPSEHSTNATVYPNRKLDIFVTDSTSIMHCMIMYCCLDCRPDSYQSPVTEVEIATADRSSPGSGSDTASVS